MPLEQVEQQPLRLGLVELAGAAGRQLEVVAAHQAHPQVAVAAMVAQVLVAAALAHALTHSRLP
jgi:hypothetical protein